MQDYKPMYIPKKIYILLFSLLGLVYFLGFLFPLMDLDATEYAMVAYRMVARHDYITIISRSLIDTREYDYLDKPHLSFWLEALCYNLFGVKDWAYRIPSFLFTLLATYSTFRLGKKMHSLEAGVLAALFFFGIQAIILENHDARTDAILGGGVIFGIWQLFEFLDGKKSWNLLLGIFGVVLGVATKGMISVVVAGTAVFFWFIFSREWKRLWDWRWIISIPVFFLFLSPVLYAYYVQFDLHPEKLVKGQYHVSGIKFILWNQSFERYAGEGEYVQYPEFIFFFHTYLWAFLPWSLLSYISVFDRAKTYIEKRFRNFSPIELAFWAAAISLFLLLSGMKYKMPHYINILFPFFSLFLASFLLELMKNKKTRYLNILTYIQGFVAVVMIALIVYLSLVSFPHAALWLWVFFIFISLLGIYYFFRGENQLVKLILPSACIGIAVNLLLNGHIYPELLKYQPGNTLADKVKEYHIPKDRIYYYGTPSRSFDFYTQRTIPCLDSGKINLFSKMGKTFYLYVEKTQIEELSKHSLNYSVIDEVPEFRVTQLNASFLNPKTRPNTLQTVSLLKIN